MYSAASGKRYSRLATLVFVGVPHTRIPRCQVVLLDIGRETRVVTEVLGRTAVVVTITDTDRIVVENSRVTVRTTFVRIRSRHSRGHIPYGVASRKGVGEIRFILLLIRGWYSVLADSF